MAKIDQERLRSNIVVYCPECGSSLGLLDGEIWQEYFECPNVDCEMDVGYGIRVRTVFFINVLDDEEYNECH